MAWPFVSLPEAGLQFFCHPIVDTVTHLQKSNNVLCLSVKPQERWALFVEIMIDASIANGVTQCINKKVTQYAIITSIKSILQKLFKKEKTIYLLFLLNRGRTFAPGTWLLLIRVFTVFCFFCSFVFLNIYSCCRNPFSGKFLLLSSNFAENPRN